MLGKTVSDPHGMEGERGISKGLGLLDIDTELDQQKTLAQVQGHCAFADAAVTGYEIHMGRSQGPALSHPAFEIAGRPEGARSMDDQILGTYLHGVFDHPAALHVLLQWAGLQTHAEIDFIELRERSIDRIADAAIPLFEALSKQ